MTIRTLAVAAALAFAASTQAAIVIFTANLDGPSESPANASPGIGFATITFDTTLHTMNVNATFSGLLGATTASHIHAATTTPGVGTAGVATQTPTFSGFPLGVTSGVYNNTFDMTLATSYNAPYLTANGGTPASAEAALLLAAQQGRAYLNIHSQSFPGGEIRGFLVPTPGGAFVLGVGGLLAAHVAVADAEVNLEVCLLGRGRGGVHGAIGHADVTEVLIGHDGAGRLKVLIEGPNPVELNTSIFPGSVGWAEAEPGFESLTINNPGEGVFIPKGTANLAWTLITIDPTLRVLNDTGSGPLVPGEIFHLGPPFFDIHPFFNIMGGVPGQVHTIRLKVVDLASVYTESEEFDIQFTSSPCYANCDASDQHPHVTANDFVCFINKFASGDPYANCDGSTGTPALSANDFICFVNAFSGPCEH